MDGPGLRRLLGDGPLVADGGMGTALIDTGVDVTDCMEELNLRAPARVVGIHAAFVGAGAQLVVTNTFGANRIRLDQHGLAAEVGPICAAGVALARDAGARLVGGSLGPLGVRLQPYGRVPPEDAFDAYREQSWALADAGADLLVIETQTDIRELEQAVAAARDAAPGLAVVASATFTRDDRTLLGDTPRSVAAALAELEVDAIGMNCGEGPAQAARIVASMAPAAGEIPLIARPNAGGPDAGGRPVRLSGDPRLRRRRRSRARRAWRGDRRGVLRHGPGAYGRDRRRPGRRPPATRGHVPCAGGDRDRFDGRRRGPRHAGASA